MLTSREWEVVRLLAEGRSNREIADVLTLSVRTVENHLAHLYAKLGVRSRVEAALFFVRARSEAYGPADVSETTQATIRRKLSRRPDVPGWDEAYVPDESTRNGPHRPGESVCD